ncbi:MAG: SPOR domain-containing protein [Parasphingorhabdus sp.]
MQPYLVRAGGITRLQAGPFATRAQADTMCSSVKASGNDCIVKRR